MASTPRLDSDSGMKLTSLSWKKWVWMLVSVSTCVWHHQRKTSTQGRQKYFLKHVIQEDWFKTTERRTRAHLLLPEHQNHNYVLNNHQQEDTGTHQKSIAPHPRTKKKPQWNSWRGTITIKSNPILAGWVTHKLENNNTKEVVTLLWRF